MLTATNEFFKDMARDDIKDWADTCMEFVYKDLVYTKDQVLHVTVHLDKKTPYIHCMVIPLVKKFDKGTPREDELFDYANVPDQYRTIRTPLYEDEHDEDYDDEINKGDFDISFYCILVKCL